MTIVAAEVEDLPIDPALNDRGSSVDKDDVIPKTCSVQMRVVLKVSS